VTESFWTDARVEILKKGWADGLTASAIARAIGNGCTANAVIGKRDRLRLPPRPHRWRRPAIGARMKEGM